MNLRKNALTGFESGAIGLQLIHAALGLSWLGTSNFNQKAVKMCGAARRTMMQASLCAMPRASGDRRRDSLPSRRARQSFWGMTTLKLQSGRLTYGSDGGLLRILAGESTGMKVAGSARCDLCASPRAPARRR